MVSDSECTLDPVDGAAMRLSGTTEKKASSTKNED